MKHDDIKTDRGGPRLLGDAAAFVDMLDRARIDHSIERSDSPFGPVLISCPSCFTINDEKLSAELAFSPGDGALRTVDVVE